MSAECIGFIGTGNMGGAMAMRLLDAGIALTISDPDPRASGPLCERGAILAASPREVADHAQVIFASLPSPAISREVIFGETGIVRGEAVEILIEMSTLGSSEVRAIAQQLTSTRIGFLECPVSGGPPAARAGTLAAIPCGPRWAFDRAQKALSIIAPHLFYLGEATGSAQIAKLINNHIAKAASVATFEGLAIAAKAGLDAKALIDFVNVSAGRNVTTTDKIPKAVFSGTFSHNGFVHEGLQNAHLLIEEARRLGVPTWLGPGILELYEAAADAGYRNRDPMYLIEYIETLADVDPAMRLSGKNKKTL